MAGLNDIFLQNQGWHFHLCQQNKRDQYVAQQRKKGDFSNRSDSGIVRK